MIHCPGRRKIVSVEGCYNDNKTLKPHSDVYENRNDKSKHQTSADFFEPEQLRSNNITRHHAPVCPTIRTCRAVDKCIRFILHAGIPGDEKFSHISNTDNRTGEDDDFIHCLYVFNSDIIFKI